MATALTRRTMLALCATLSACDAPSSEVGEANELYWPGHGAIAPDISAALGEPLPNASAAQLTHERRVILNKS